MNEFITPSNITFALGIIAIVFAVYRYFRDPQVKSDKKDALIEQQMQWYQETSDRRFKDTHESFASLVATNQNHIHTVDVKVDALSVTVVKIGNDIVKLATIIEERIPKKIP